MAFILIKKGAGNHFIISLLFKFAAKIREKFEIICIFLPFFQRKTLIPNRLKKNV